MTVTDAVRSRRSIRAFLPDPVPLDTLARVFDAARWAPSGCNYQPWEGTVLTGEPLAALQEKMRGRPPQDPPEYDWSAPGKHDAYAARLNAVSAAMYGAQGIARDDKAARWDFVGRNLVSFGAPGRCCSSTSRASWGRRNGPMSACGCRRSCCCCARRGWTAVRRNISGCTPG